MFLYDDGGDDETGIQNQLEIMQPIDVGVLRMGRTVGARRVTSMRWTHYIVLGHLLVA